MHKKMIALDLDGTLLNYESKLSDFTIDTIKKISALGHKVIITTGRPYRMAHTYYKQLELDTPMINFNGSLTHLPEKKWADEQCLTLDKANTAINSLLPIQMSTLQTLNYSVLNLSNQKINSIPSG